MKAKSLVFKLIPLAAVIYGMFTVTEGIMTLTKFTTLANVGMGIAMIMMIIAELTAGDSIPRWIFNVKFVMTTAMALTFLIVLFVMAPTNSEGFIACYTHNKCGSLAHHVIAPIFAVLDFYINDEGYVPSVLTAVLSVLFPFLYVAGTVVLAALGVRWSYGMCSPYNFLNFGAPVGWFGFDLSTMGKTSLGIGVAYMSLLLCILFIFMSLFMRAIKKKVVKSE